MQLAADFTETQHGDNWTYQVCSKKGGPKKVWMYEIPRPCTSRTTPYAVQVSPQLQTLSPTIARELHKLSKKARGWHLSIRDTIIQTT
jgi:hypothetical protein